MKLHNLKVTPGARKKPKVLGRGDGSGHGGTSGRGHKGDKARSGTKIRLHFEGGQNTFFRRLPKVGFKSMDKVSFNIINVDLISKNFSIGDTVDEQILRKKGLLADKYEGLKVLGNGNIDKAVTVKANAFSASAKAKIEAAGGKCELIGNPAPASQEKNN
ncbi:MAG TPA: 50S ribosomal protein L15 [Victivallales bacterium]|mgnify:CR=1 FL=1|nr:50S ribosomal protein L15 [Victivallales bacterium]HRU01056.1 50S ribosomal protein L15 [Victivallales bacterium]